MHSYGIILIIPAGSAFVLPVSLFKFSGSSSAHGKVHNGSVSHSLSPVCGCMSYDTVDGKLFYLYGEGNNNELSRYYCGYNFHSSA